MENKLSPTEILTNWIEAEKQQGVQYAQHAVIATIGLDNKPHSRTVAIKLVNEAGILFFTQRCTRKVAELKANHHISATFWLPMTARQVVVEGEAVFLSDAENQIYWTQYPDWAKIRFYSYAPTSGQIIESKQMLENKRNDFHKAFENQDIMMSKDYCGIKIIPKRVVFYTYRLDELSDVVEYVANNGEFVRNLLSP